MLLKFPAHPAPLPLYEIPRGNLALVTSNTVVAPQATAGPLCVCILTSPSFLARWRGAVAIMKQGPFVLLNIS